MEDPIIGSWEDLKGVDELGLFWPPLSLQRVT